MPRVRQVPIDPQPQAVTVIGQIFGAAAGQVVLVTLERQCTWRGQLVPMRLETRTLADGEFRVSLPPSVELLPVDGQTPQYILQAPGLRRFHFVVPQGVEVWRLDF